MLEFIGELILDFIMEVTKNKKITRWIRYPLLIIIILLFSFIIGGIFLVAMGGFQRGDIFMGTVMMVIDFIMIAGLYIFFRKKTGGKS